MDFYNELMRVRTWKRFIEFLEIMSLQILKTDISLLNWIRKLLGFSYSAKIIIGNSIVTYLLEVEILETKDEVFIKINDIKIL